MQSGLLQRNKDLGKVLFNLTIAMHLNTRTFKSHPIMSAEDQIEMMGMAINRFKRLLKGDWQVTEQGYLVRGTAEVSDNRTAVLDIEDAVVGLEKLEKISNRQIECEGNLLMPHLHFEGGGIMDVGGDERGLYLVDIHQPWQTDEFLREMEESGLTDKLIRMNNERCHVAGISSQQDYPLPEPFENIRAFFLRLGDRLERLRHK